MIPGWLRAETWDGTVVWKGKRFYLVTENQAIPFDELLSRILEKKVRIAVYTKAEK